MTDKGTRPIFDQLTAAAAASVTLSCFTNSERAEHTEYTEH